jgi:hypothetical protein
LVSLRALLPAVLSAKLGTRELAELTQWGTESRYPGDWDEPSAEVAIAMIDVAEIVVAAMADSAWLAD